MTGDVVGYVESRHVSDTELGGVAMAGDVRVTAGVAKVLAALLEDPTADRYGLDLMRATAMPSGTLYPILTRLRDAGWVRAEWEQPDPDASRPARRYYRLTPEGVVAAREGVAELAEKLGGAMGGRGRRVLPRPSANPGPA
ncbi:PadR family transcriptional regulator [Phytohabitans sp. LJ34]|uniref:PadR family transcriptional regulator n=1 Tax=Phytohabitans sp. LJ34 TaxID=3452217 RepID=UPI003F89347A